MNAQERNRRLKALGYRLVRNYYCPIRRRKMPYATVPDQMGGGTVVHENLSGVDARIVNAEMVRSWQAQEPPS